jgi:hypothetical protein
MNDELLQSIIEDCLVLVNHLRFGNIGYAAQTTLQVLNILVFASFTFPEYINNAFLVQFSQLFDKIKKDDTQSAADLVLCEIIPRLDSCKGKVGA